MTHFAVPLLTAALLVLAEGCALTNKGPVLAPRFFSPVPPALEPTTTAGGARPAQNADGLELRLGAVDAASYLEERIAYRLSAAELGYYDDRRWTERPDEYLRRALERELFERRPLHRIVAGAAPTLDVELTAFEELRGDPPRVRLALRFTLRDDREVTLARSLVVERRLPANQPDRASGVALALGEALEQAVSELGDDVTRGLTSAPAAQVAGGGSTHAAACP